jgi:hypothetical protein
LLLRAAARARGARGLPGVSVRVHAYKPWLDRRASRWRAIGIKPVANCEIAVILQARDQKYAPIAGRARGAGDGG